MKKVALFGSAIAALLVLAVASPAIAAEEGQSKEVTIKGEAKCAKCALKEGSKCQTVVQAENDSGEKVTYYLASNQAAKDFHSNVCKEAKKVTATGTVKKVEGKQELTVTKIEVVKD